MASQTELAKPKRLRLFIAVNLPESVKEFIRTISSSRSRLRDVRWTNPGQLHLTLKFLGHLPAEIVTELDAQLKAACRGYTPFRLGAEGVGCFPGVRNARIVWVGISGEVELLCELQRRIELAVSPWAAPEERPFKPHLTIGRINPPSAFNRAGLDELIKEFERKDFGQWTVDSVDLMQSRLSPTGSSYICLNTASFRE